MSSPMWYVLQTKPRDEQRAVRELARVGIKTVCPMMVQYRARRRQRETVPLFPGYLFANFDYMECYHRVKWTPGVSRLVQFGETPSSLEDAVVESLITLMDDAGIIDQAPVLSEGDLVQFRYGPLEGLVGTVLRMDTAQERILVLMEHLSYQAKLMVDRYQVTAV